jgi:hypothetical protein
MTRVVSSPSPQIGARSLLLAFGLSLVTLSAACTCGGSAGERDAGGDAGPDHSLPDRGVDIGVDISIDRGVDGPGGDLYPTGACGGQRKLVPTVVPPGPASACGAGCQRVTWGASPARDWDVKGDLLVYRNVTGSPGGSRVYYVDLATRTEHRVHNNWPYVVGGCSVVATDGKRIATSCVRSFTGPPIPAQWLRSLTTYDPKTHLETDHLCIERKLSDQSCFPDLIVFNTSGITINLSLATKCINTRPWHLAFGSTTLKDLAEPNTQSQIGHVRGDGKIVVWSEGRKEWKHYQVVAYDLDTGKRWRVDPSNSDQWLPQVAGDKIVWVDHRNDPSGYRLNPKNSDIYMHDLSSGKTTAVTTHPARQEEADIDGDWVIWHDYRGAPDGISGKEIDIWAKNMATGKEYQVTAYPHLEVYPRVDNGRLFYQRVVNGSTGIHMIDIATWIKAGSKPGGGQP